MNSSADVYSTDNPCSNVVLDMYICMNNVDAATTFRDDWAYTDT